MRVAGRSGRRLFHAGQLHGGVVPHHFADALGQLAGLYGQIAVSGLNHKAAGHGGHHTVQDVVNLQRHACAPWVALAW